MHRRIYTCLSCSIILCYVSRMVYFFVISSACYAKKKSTSKLITITFDTKFQLVSMKKLFITYNVRPKAEDVNLLLFRPHKKKPPQSYLTFQDSPQSVKSFSIGNNYGGNPIYAGKYVEDLTEGVRYTGKRENLFPVFKKEMSLPGIIR